MNDRERMPGGIEIRYNEDETVDEILVRDKETGKCLLHMEQMNEARYWIGLYGYGDSLDDANAHHVDLFTDGSHCEDPDDKHLQKLTARLRT
jgi:hypothetical protein